MCFYLFWCGGRKFNINITTSNFTKKNNFISRLKCSNQFILFLQCFPNVERNILHVFPSVSAIQMRRYNCARSRSWSKTIFCLDKMAEWFKRCGLSRLGEWAAEVVSSSSDRVEGEDPKKWFFLCFIYLYMYINWL